MQNILEIIKNSNIYITLAMIILIIVMFIITMYNISVLNKLEKKYKKMMRGVEGTNLEEFISQYLNKIDEVKNENQEVKEIFYSIDERLKKCIQRVSIIRYKAFEDVGSDLSFSIALLNDNNDGIVLTSIYGRNESTTYAKPIDKGISRYDLSEEEQEALNEAMNK